jgi:K(+)-stimulated pyrophosphate-energized sodium pump
VAAAALIRLVGGDASPAVAGGALGAGAAAAAMAMRLATVPDPEPHPFRPELTALTMFAATSGAWFGAGEAAVWPTITVTVGVAAAAAVSPLVVRSDPTHSLLWRGWIVAAVVAVSGPVAAVVSPPEGVRHPIGLGLAVTAGAVGAVVVGELIRLYTSDRWRPAKRVAARARTGAAAVITTGLADAARATGWLLAGVAAVGVAADRFGRLADEHDLALVLAVAAMTACLAAMAVGLEVSAIAEGADSPEDDASPEDQAAAADLLAAGSVVGALGRGTVTLVGSLSALTLLLIGLRRAALDPAGGWAAVGGLAGVAAIWYATGWLSTTADGDTASPRRGGYAAAAALAAAVAAALVSPAAGLGAVAGAVVSGGALAFWGGVAAGSWQNVRRLIEAGAYGGVGSRAHRAVVAADAVGSRWRGVIVPGLISALLSLAALVALFSAPPS